MFKRIRDSLVYPKEILNYRKDHILFVLLYIAFFALLLSSRSVIDVIKYDGLTSAYKASIEEEMTIVSQDCEILDATLVCDGEHYINLYSDPLFTIYLYSGDIALLSEYPSDNYSIIINDDQAHFYVVGRNSLSIPLSDLPSSLHNIDFADQVNNPSVFYNNLFNGIDDLLVLEKSFWGPMVVLVEMFVTIAFYLVFILMSASFLKMRHKVIPFKETFTLTTYSSTSLFIILTFYSMLDLNIIIIVILLVISFRQNGIMSREIDRRLKNKS